MILVTEYEHYAKLGKQHTDQEHSTWGRMSHTLTHTTHIHTNTHPHTTDII